MKHTRGQRNVDNYDGHLLLTELEGDELVHSVCHPDTCEEVDMGGWEDYVCAVAFAQNGGGECWGEATTAGLRIVGWRHDYYPSGPWGGAEHDVVAWCLPETLARSSAGGDVLPRPRGGALLESKPDSGGAAGLATAAPPTNETEQT